MTSVQFTLTGTTDIAAAVKAAIEAGTADVVGPLMEEMEEIRGASMEIVPFDQGDLHASALDVGVTPERDASGVTVTIGYGGPGIGYAVVQHETPPEVFSHTEGRSWKYLEKPALEATQGMEQRLGDRIRRRFEAAAGGGIPGGGGSGDTFEGS